MDILEIFSPDPFLGIKQTDDSVTKLPGCSYSERMFRLKCVIIANHTRNDSNLFRYTFPFLAWSLLLLSFPASILPLRLFSSTSLTMGEKSKNLEVFSPLYFPSQAIISSYLQKEFDPVSELRDCLLYTSPSPRDVEESRMPSSA